MLTDKNELRKIILTVTELFNAEKQFEIVELLRTSEINSEPTYYDNWNGGTTYFSIYLTWTSQNQTGEMLTLQDGTPYRNLQRENSLSTFMLR